MYLTLYIVHTWCNGVPKNKLIFIYVNYTNSTNDYNLFKFYIGTDYSDITLVWVKYFKYV